LKNYHLNKIVFFVFIITIKLNGQVYPSQNITMQEGLPSNNVYDITMDKFGTYWAATENGLAKIEGNKITSFSVKDGLPHNNCWQVEIDNQGVVWTGTYGGGLSYIKNNEILTIDETKGLVNNYIRKLYYRHPFMYVGTKNGLSIINTLNFTIQNYTLNQERIQIMDFFEYKNTIHIISYKSGSYRIKKNKLKKINDEINFFSCYKDRDTLILSKDGNNIGFNSIHKISINDFISNHPNFKKFGNSVFWDFIKLNGKTYGCAWGVNFDSGGFYQIENNFLTKINDTYEIGSNNIISNFIDKQRSILLLSSLDNGIYKIDLNNLVSFEKRTDLLLSLKFETNSRILLFDEYVEINNNNFKTIFNKMDFLNHIKKQILYENLNERFLSKYLLRDFDIDNNYFKTNFKIKNVDKIGQDLYLYTTIGVFIISYSKDKFKIKDYYPISINNAFYKIDNNSFLFQFPFSNVKLVDNLSQKLKITNFEIENNYNPRDIIKFIKIQDVVFAVSRYSGIYKFINGNFESLLHNNTISEKEFLFAKRNNENSIVLADYLGNIYILSYENNKLTFTKVIQFNLISGNTIFGIEEYKDYFIIATNFGINIIKKDLKRIVFLDEEQNFDAKNIKNISVINDNLEIASRSGIYHLNLLKLLNKKNNSNILFVKSISINGKQKLNTQNKILLGYDENKIDIELASKSIVYPKKIKFKYRIIGLENNSWSNWISWNNIKTINIPYLPPGDFKIQLHYEDEFIGNKGTFALLNISIQKPFWKTYWFMFSMILMLVVVIFLVVKFQIKKINNRNQEKIFFEKKIAESKNLALKSQMNPHFVFNAINAIQNFVISNDIDSSIEYMNSFSILIRKTLDYSSKELISISEEIKFLKNYVKIQNLRFGNKIKFKININSNLNTKITEMPPMLLQPIIENCFEHAFNESIENPQIVLEFNKITSGILIKVNDNGIGFKQSKTHKSKGIKLVEERLVLLNPKNHLSIYTEFGTSVEIFIQED